MLTFDNPVSAANAFSDYVTVHYASIPEALQARALAASRERSPAVCVVKGMELCYAVLRDEAETLPDREITLNTLGALAHQVSENDFWARSERALLLQRGVKYELGELHGNAAEPEWPELDEEYRVPAAQPVDTNTPEEPET